MQPSKKKTISVKDKLNGNEIDLSLLELTDVPVKELVKILCPVFALNLCLVFLVVVGFRHSWHHIGPFQQQTYYPQRNRFANLDVSLYHFLTICFHFHRFLSLLLLI